MSRRTIKKDVYLQGSQGRQSRFRGWSGVRSTESILRLFWWESRGRQAIRVGLREELEERNSRYIKKGAQAMAFSVGALLHDYPHPKDSYNIKLDDTVIP